MTKEHLQQYRALKSEYRQIEQRLRNLERRPDEDQQTLQPLRECYKQKLEALTREQLAIERAIERLNSFERQLVRLRYIDGLPWYKVAYKLQYSEAQAKRIGRRILAKLEKQ